MINENKIFRIIDVNTNRAMEGLRVVEEICRFILEDEELTLQIKKMRGSLKKAMKAHESQGGQRGLKARRALEDVGRDMYTVDEGRRTNIENVFRSNIKRAQEAVRCLEEFSKLLNPKSGRTYKLIRYELYELEKHLSPRVSKYVKLDFDLYVVTDPQFDHLATMRQAIAAGVKIIQLRDKGISKDEYLKLARRMVTPIHRAGLIFILNDYWDLLAEVGADGVHLGQEDIAHLSLAKVRKRIGEDKIIGISTHSFGQAGRAEKLGADYISLGPVFATPSKPGRKPVGLTLLKRVIGRVKMPVVAIGGINRTNVKRLGCQRFAAIRGWQSIVQR